MDLVNKLVVRGSDLDCVSGDKHRVIATSKLSDENLSMEEGSRIYKRFEADSIRAASAPGVRHVHLARHAWQHCGNRQIDRGVKQTESVVGDIGVDQFAARREVRHMERKHGEDGVGQCAPQKPRAAFAPAGACLVIV